MARLSYRVEECGICFDNFEWISLEEDDEFDQILRALQESLPGPFTSSNKVTFDPNVQLSLGSSMPCNQGHLYCFSCLGTYMESQLKGKVYCPNKKCAKLMDGDALGASDGGGSSWEVSATCPYCRESFCALCLSGAHKGKTCKQVKLESSDDYLFDTLAAKSAWKKCPGCGHMVEKISAILKVSETATTEDIREAYKREALRTHPDRTTNIGGEAPLSKEEATVLFQQVADAYYVLSSTDRRREYDNAKRNKSRSGWSTSAAHAEPDSVFGGVFEELLRPEVENPSSFYSSIGMASGAAIGFICGSIPGALLGGYGGKTLGSIRDRKGVSVMEAFMRLEHAHKAAIIATLAAKIFQSLQ
ncbi:hypothetical protein BGX26_002734 [Mortierella sp. AD094]|nr:hypothetical protein BGX26_002734 [Mortierella sp. AD094]